MLGMCMGEWHLLRQTETFARLFNCYYGFYVMSAVEKHVLNKVLIAET